MLKLTPFTKPGELEPFDAEKFRAPFHGLHASGNRDVAADHQAGDLLLVRQPGFAGAAHATIAENGNPVGQGKHFRHLVGDVDDRDTLGLKPRDRAEQRIGFGQRQRRSGLVEDHHRALEGNRARDLDHLLMGE